MLRITVVILALTTLLFVDPVRAQNSDPPCKSATKRGTMNFAVPTPNGSGMLKIGASLATFDYVQHRICLAFAGNPDFGVRITPDKTCFDADEGVEPVVRAILPQGEQIIMYPEGTSFKASYESNRLACMGAKAESSAGGT
jgi:hypothetical protein